MGLNHRPTPKRKAVVIHVPKYERPMLVPRGHLDAEKGSSNASESTIRKIWISSVTKDVALRVLFVSTRSLAISISPQVEVSAMATCTCTTSTTSLIAL